MRTFAAIAPMTHKLLLPAALLLYGVLAAVLLPHMLWFVDNPDTFQYMMLAHRYADGSFLNVINGYWSPLIIWLLVLPIKLLGNGIIAFKAINLLIGAATLVVWHRLLIVARLGSFHGLLLFAAIPFMLSYALIVLTPDLLFLMLSLVLLVLILRPVALGSRRNAILLGIIGAAMYLAKAFGLPMFLGLLALLIILEIRWRPGDRQKILRHAGIALLVLGITTLPWIIALSMRYGHFTISEAARFNQTVEVAPMPEEIKLMPLITDGTFIPPPGAISAWETPGDMVDLTPLRPWTHPHRFMLLVKRNVLSTYYHDVRRQLGMVFIPLLLLGIMLRGRPLLQDRVLLWSLLFMLVLNTGYSLILVHGRYIWLNTFLMLLCCAILLRHLLPAHKEIRLALLLAILLLAVKRPVKEILLREDADVSRHDMIAHLLSPISTVRNTYEEDHVRKRVIDSLRPLGMQGSIASLFSPDGARLSYPNTMHVAYELGLVFHGEVSEDDPREVQLQALHSQQIRYFAVWQGMHWDHGRVIFDASAEGPRIFDLQAEL
jgi:hypothetical protein